MIAFIRQYWILIAVFVAVVIFVCKYIVADLPDDILSQAYKRIKQSKKGGDNGGLRDHW